MRYLLPFILAGASLAVANEPHLPVTFKVSANCVDILVDDVPFAVYVYEDTEIFRPYFCRVLAPNGMQVTRTHPPDPGTDRDNRDHATFHPGIWLAFGDLGGADFWRLRARVRHLRFEETPGDNPGVFTVVNVYETLDTPPRALCEETCTYTVTADSTARWIKLESRFRALEPGISFGDQEEMGLGVRIATALTVKHGNGTIVNSLGGVNEEGTWGRAPDWCAYSGLVEEQRSGVLLMANPGNFRRSWYHNRNYGLMVANPFGKKSMTAPKEDAVAPDATALPMDTPLSLGFAVCVFSTGDGDPPDYGVLFAHYLASLDRSE